MNILMLGIHPDLNVPQPMPGRHQRYEFAAQGRTIPFYRHSLIYDDHDSDSMEESSGESSDDEGQAKMPGLMFDSKSVVTKQMFWDSTYGDAFYRDSTRDKTPANVEVKQCDHGHDTDNFIDEYHNPTNDLRYHQHLLMEGLSMTNTHP